MKVLLSPFMTLADTDIPQAAIIAVYLAEMMYVSSYPSLHSPSGPSKQQEAAKDLPEKHP